MPKYIPVFLWIVCGLTALTPLSSAGQSDGVLQVDDEIYRFLTRMQTAGVLKQGFLAAQPLAVHVARAYLDSVATRAHELSAVDRAILARLQGADNSALLRRIRGALPFVYENGIDLLSVSGDGYRMQLNPLLYASVGRARLSERPDRDSSMPIWRSTRGLRASGSLADQLFFEARVEENQERVVDAGYDDDRKTAPRLGKANYDADRQVLDYLIATGVVGYRSRFVEVRFGRDRNRWDTAIGSIVLSNYSTVYDQLQIRTTVGPVQYTNLFVSLATGRISRNDAVIPKKYAAMHRLSIALPHRIELAVTESVVFATDSLGARKSFDIAYLNPLIFLRAAEADRGSPDNVLLGGSASWIPIKGFRVYGGLFLDELRVPEIGKKWWANKWAVQWGLHAVPHPSIDFRIEYTRLRPYLYAHREPLNAYVHYDDGLGHPAGPNAIDWLAVLSARPVDRLQATLSFYRTIRGRDSTSANFGADPTVSSATRVADRPVPILQGVRQTELQVDLLVSWEILPRFFGDVRLGYRAVDDAIDGFDRSVQPMIGLRWGLTRLSRRY